MLSRTGRVTLWCGRWLVCLLLAGCNLMCGHRQTAANEPDPVVERTKSASAMEAVARVGGQALAVELVENRAFVGIGPRVAFFDLAAADAPRKLGQTPPLPDRVRGLVVQKNHAFVAAASAGLVIYDISDPAAPSKVASFATEGEAVGVDVVGNHAYLGDERAGLLVLDLSDITSPRKVGTFTKRSGLLSLDTNPAQIPDYRDIQIAAAGERVFMQSRPRARADRVGIRILDVSSPEGPRQIGFHELGPHPNGLSSSGPLVVCLNEVLSHASVFRNGENGESLQELAKIPATTTSSAVALDSNRALMLSRSGDLTVFDLSTLESPSKVAHHERLVTAMDVREVAYSENRVYLGCAEGLFIYDVTDAANPRFLSMLPIEGLPQSVAVAENTVFYAVERMALHLIDVTDPSAPRRLSGLATPAYAGDTSVVGHHAFVRMREQGLHIFDVSDPASPQKVGVYTHPGIDVTWATVAGTRAYLIENMRKLSILDISNPTAPNELGSIDIEGRSIQATVADGKAYVSGDSLDIFDVSTPSTPRLLGSFQASGFIGTVEVDGSTVYLANGEHGVLRLDVSDPANPRRRGAYNPPETIGTIALGNGHLFVPEGSTGLGILRLPSPE